MDNIDYFESVAAWGGEEGLSARNRVRLLAKQVCSRFEPFRQYFSPLPIARITRSRPHFTPTISHSLRDNLHVQRQVKYLRGMLSQDYSQETLQEMLGEDQHRPIRKLRNSIVVKADSVYWAEETVIQQVNVKDFLVREVIQGKEQWNASMVLPKVLVDLREWIYELAVTQENLYARTPRALFVVSLQNGRIMSRAAVDEQLISWHCRPSQNGRNLLLSTYQSRFSQLYEQAQQKMQLWCRVDGLVHSMWSKTANEVVLCEEGAILVADRRKKMVHQLHRRANVHENRIYSAVSLGETVLGSRYFATTQSFDICIYDLRKPHEAVLKMPHFCEEAPPSVLQTWSSSQDFMRKEPTLENFDQFVTVSQQWREECPLLIAHSPYSNGSSLFAELDIKWQNPQQLLKLQFNGQINQFSNKLRLLYDSGKMQQHYHPRGIAPFMPIKGQVGFLHLDNFHGISLQIFERVPANHGFKNYKTSPYNFVYQGVNMAMQQTVEELQPANQQWFIRQDSEKQIQAKTQDHWSEVLGEQQLQEQPFEQRVVRFADLKHFYHRVREQAQEMTLQERMRQEQMAALKDKIAVREVRLQPTQSQTQGEDAAIRQGMQLGRLSEQAIGELLEEWSSL